MEPARKTKLKCCVGHCGGVRLEAKPQRRVYTCTLMMIDSNRLRYYIHRELFLSAAGSDLKYCIFNLKESLDE